MLNPEKIIELIHDGMKKNVDTQSSLTKTFMQNVGGDSVSGNDMSRVIMNDVTKSCENMLSNMNNIFNELSADVSKHQKSQLHENTNDFDVSGKGGGEVSDDFKSELKNFISKINEINKDLKR
ncbi:TPA: DUF6277 family protein [Serratia liquefaciens]